MSTDNSPPSFVVPLPKNEEDGDCAQTNGCSLARPPFGLEQIYDYERGGHHPVHLHDLLGDGRYRVIHKLGNGGFANIWLCQDTAAEGTTKYIAVKIVMAETSSLDYPELRINQVKDWHTAQQEQDDDAGFICFPLDYFTMRGPNSDHLCFVYPALGPKVSLGLSPESQDPDKLLRTIYVTPSNVLHRIHGLNGLTEDEVLKILGQPTQNPVLKGSVKNLDESTVPKYLVYPVKWRDVDRQFISKDSCLIDFGESFEIAKPPEDIGIPGPYRSPELILENKIGVGTDLWALGCSLFEIRTGRKLFDAFDDDDDSYLEAMVQVLGKLPEPWWSTTWKDRKSLYKDKTDEHGRAVDAVDPTAEADSSKTKPSNVSVHPSGAEGARSLLDKLRPGLSYMSKGSRDGDIHRDISEQKMRVFSDLLGKLLRYDPKDRITAATALGHEWFKL
ncbi:Fc.00g003990.m01.CDS01 [Cosmosporella sp. VM-42]